MHGRWSGRLLAMALPPRSGSIQIAYCTSLAFWLLGEQVRCSRSSFFWRMFSFIADFAINSCSWHLPQSTIDLYQLPSQSSTCALSLSLSLCTWSAAAFKRLTRFLKSKTGKCSVQTKENSILWYLFYGHLCFSWNALMLGSILIR